MTTRKQTQALAVKRNLRKAQAAWRAKSHRQKALALSQGRTRRKPGITGKGEYYHVVVRPKEEFVTFRSQDIGKRGHTIRVAGKRKSGTWATQKWLISKNDALIKNGLLKAKDKKTEEILNKLVSSPKHTRGDIFLAKDRLNAPVRTIPTAKQKRSSATNIKKTQAARSAKSKKSKLTKSNPGRLKTLKKSLLTSSKTKKSNHRNRNLVLAVSAASAGALLLGARFIRKLPKFRK